MNFDQWKTLHASSVPHEYRLDLFTTDKFEVDARGLVDIINGPMKPAKDGYIFNGVRLCTHPYYGDEHSQLSIEAVYVETKNAQHERHVKEYIKWLDNEKEKQKFVTRQTKEEQSKIVERDINTLKFLASKYDFDIKEKDNAKLS